MGKAFHAQGVQEYGSEYVIMAETDYPLLVFPAPTPIERAKRGSPFPKIRIPEASQQARRLMPQFQRLHEAMDEKRAALQGNPVGIQPEQVLVLETVGSVEDFINAVGKISGLEWLGDYDLDDIPPDHGFDFEERLKEQRFFEFKDEIRPDKRLKGQLFLVMTDQRALQELHSLFKRWENEPDVEFPEGLAPFKKAFAHLHTIRPWDAEDRIRETGIIDDWRVRLQTDQDDVPFEVELWFRKEASRRQQAASWISSIVASLDGEVVQQCVISEIAYHAVLARIHRKHIPDITHRRDAFQNMKLLQCEDVMHLRPVGQCEIPEPENVGLTDALKEKHQHPPPQGEPLIALFDGMPLSGHRLLDARLVVDDPDGYENDYQANERVHGTAIASLICYGDLNNGGDPLVRPIYARPILKPRRGWNGGFIEGIPDEVLPTDLIHRAVRRLYESEGGEPPSAPSVRVINLSVGDRTRPLFRVMSSWARLLDWLSWKYNVLFVVSAGNHSQDLELAVPRGGVGGLTLGERERTVIKAIAADVRNRRLLSPAETINGLTIGAIHSDASSPSPSGLIDPFPNTSLPSVISARGPGYRRAIKPDLLLAGGRQFLSEKPGTTHSKAILQTNSYTLPPGQCVATPGSSGQVDQTTYTRGTSNAAALASRAASFLHQVIEQLRGRPDTYVPEDFDVVIIKTLLVHGASWSDVQPQYEAALKNPQNRRNFNEYLGSLLGYGSADLSRVAACTQQRVTVLGLGQIDDGEGAAFRFPLPPCLSSLDELRRLTITLAWLSPVNCNRKNYRMAHLWFNPKYDLAPKRIFANHTAVRRGTVQHEVLEGDKAVAFQDGDSISIKVNCRSDASDVPAPIRFGLAVTLEVADAIEIPIYQQVRDRIAIRVPVQSASL